jgi:hypothetical protein
MNRSDLQELHYITIISNIPSIMTKGILSHKRSKRINHNSVAMEEIQERRKKKIVPGGVIGDNFLLKGKLRKTDCLIDQINSR